MNEQYLSSVCQWLILSFALLSGGSAVYAEEAQKITTRVFIEKSLLPNEGPGKNSFLKNKSSQPKGLVQVNDNRGKLILKNINFSFNSTELSPTALAQLNELGLALSSPSLRPYQFKISIPSNVRGRAKNKQALLKQRAETIRKYLIENFKVDANRLHIGVWNHGKLSAIDNQIKVAPGRLKIKNMGFSSSMNSR